MTAFEEREKRNNSVCGNEMLINLSPKKNPSLPWLLSKVQSVNLMLKI